MKNKNFICEINITDLEFPGNGVGYKDGDKVCVKGAIPGQRVSAKIRKKKGTFSGKVVETISKAPMEIEPACLDFGKCGGCAYQNIPYPDEVSLKEKMVLKLFEKHGIKDFIYEGIAAAPSDSSYRNKMEYSFGDLEKGGRMSLGIRRKDAYYEVVTPEYCGIIDGDNKKVLLTVLDYFENSGETFHHKILHTGSLRHLIVRKGFFTGEILINLVTTSELKTELEPLVSRLTGMETDGVIVGVLHTVNDSPADVVRCDKLEILHGRDFFYERLSGLTFKISAFSFFQTNSAGAEKLYETARDFTGWGEHKPAAPKVGTVFDLYCGTGTIAQIISPYAKKVIGVELVEEAAEAAKENAALNGIANCDFIAGDVLRVVEEIKEKPDLIILDPPREGIHPKAIHKIISFSSDKIIYISCKPTSLVRDLEIFQENGYRCERVKIHDMFPRTAHVECVVLMSRGEG